MVSEVCCGGWRQCHGIVAADCVQDGDTVKAYRQPCVGEADRIAQDFVGSSQLGGWLQLTVAVRAAPKGV